jgi:hypothetical protein
LSEHNTSKVSGGIRVSESGSIELPGVEDVMSSQLIHGEDVKMFVLVS